jgi:O-antigen ligase
MQLATVMFLSVGIRLIKKNKFLGIMAMVIAIAVMIPLVPQKYWERASTITQFSDPAIGKRLAGWKVGTDLFMENPLIGVGFGMFRYEYFMKSITSSDVRFKMGLDAHNLYIHTAAETGIFGLLFLILLIIFTFKYLSAAKKNFMTKGDLYLAEIFVGYTDKPSCLLSGRYVHIVFATSYILDHHTLSCRFEQVLEERVRWLKKC